MSEDTPSCQIRVLVNGDPDMASSVDYSKTPISGSPKMPKATVVHFPSSSSGPGSSRFRHKSPGSRHLSPHRSVSKNKITFDWKDINNSLRKTQSTALPAVTTSPWSRSTTVSTPDLKIEDQSIVTEDRNGRGTANLSMARPKLYCILQLILVILSCTILAAGLIHLGAALILTVYKENVLIIVEYRSYFSCVMALYITSIILIVWPLIGLWAIHRKSWKKQHLACSLHAAVFAIALGMFQTTVQTNIRNRARDRMMASVAAQSELSETAGVVWDYIQKSFKCCGTQGQLDWCEKTDEPKDLTKPMDFLGTYICHLPISCCNEDIEETASSGKYTKYSHRTAPCSVSPTLWNTHRIGCLGHVKREMQYVAKLLRIICFGPAIFFVGSSAVAGILYYYARRWSYFH